ncbi:hypothetical protein L7F22_004188 [Adiantum nelumboides]|nr:hypothetical protein [Adiantum nelumboides]
MEPVVLDVGSKLVKAGFAYPDQDPSMVFSTAMVKTKDEEPEKSDSEDEELVLEDIVNPISRGIIKDWELMEDLWRYIFYTGLGWEVGNEGQLLITEPLLTPKVVREKVVQVMFETFNVTGFYAVEQAVLSLYSVGRISGCAVDVGHGKTDIAPVWEGALQHNCVKRLELGGEDLTKLLLEEFGRNNSERKLDLATAEMLKDTVSAVADDYAAIMQDCPVEEHILPDGQRQQPTSVPPARVPPTHASPDVSQVSATQQAQSGGGSRARSHHPTTSQPAAAHRPGKAPTFAMDVDFPPLDSHPQPHRRHASDHLPTLPTHVDAPSSQVDQPAATLLLPPPPPPRAPKGFMDHAPPLWGFPKAESSLDSTGHVLVRVYVIRRTKKGMSLAGSTQSPMLSFHLPFAGSQEWTEQL